MAFSNGTASLLVSLILPDIRPLQALILIITLLLLLTSIIHAGYHFRYGSFSTKNKLLSPLGILASSLLYCYVADRTILFHQLTKQRDETTFIGLCLLGLMCGIATVRSHNFEVHTLEKPQTVGFELLSRQQTEEWKGWMQIAILLYHYFGMSKVLHVYRIIRLLVGSYLFMTGYGHTIYFLRTSDFSFRRAAAVLIRLNLLACLLPLVMGTKYELYYFPILSSFWFLVTWMTIPRTTRGIIDVRRIVWRTLASCLATELLFSVPRLWNYFTAFLRFAKMVDLNANELVFRLSLDRYVTYVGILTACANEYVRHIHRSDAASLDGLRLLYGRGAAICFCALCGYLTLSTALNTKEASNRAHAFTESIPILVFVMFRNATPFLRRHQSRLFSWFGRYSLETFLFQYHIWLAADAKKLLCFKAPVRALPSGSYNTRSLGFWIEWCVLSAVFLTASYSTSKATSLLTARIVGPGQVSPGDEVVVSNEQSDSNAFVKLMRLARLAFRLSLKCRVATLIVLLWVLNAI